MTRALVPTVLLLTSLLAAAAGAARENRQSQEQNTGGVLAPIAKAPAKVRDRANPYEGRADAIAAGEKLFRQHCAECHGDDALGKNHAANLRSPAVQNATPGQLAWLLWNGNLWHGMPSWSGLPEQRRWQIVTYLKSLGTAPTSSVPTKTTQRPNGQ
jgi:mono/diheme cytochrome c family protein